MNRNNANPLASQGTLPGTLTLGRIKTDRKNFDTGFEYYLKIIINYINNIMVTSDFRYNIDSTSRNNLQLSQNNTFNTLGRSTNSFQRNIPNNHDLGSSTINRNNRYADMSNNNPLVQHRYYN